MGLCIWSIIIALHRNVSSDLYRIWTKLQVRIASLPEMRDDRKVGKRYRLRAIETSSITTSNIITEALPLSISIFIRFAISHCLYQDVAYAERVYDVPVARIIYYQFIDVEFLILKRSSLTESILQLILNRCMNYFNNLVKH